MPYNGSANWETWNVCLWFDNDYGLYEGKLAFIRRTPVLTAENVEEYVRETLPNGTADFGDAGDYDAVDWQEVADTWEGDR